MTGPRSAGGEPKRNGTKVDSYAKFQIRRQFRLTAIEAAILLDLVLLADWRDPFWSWEGTITELHNDTGWSRRALHSANPDKPGALNVFAAKRLIVIERDFGGGQYASGLIRIPIYEWLVMVHPSQMRSRQSARIPDDLFAPDARSTRAQLALDSRQKARVQARNPDERGERLRGKEGEGVSEKFSGAGSRANGPLLDADDSPPDDGSAPPPSDEYAPAPDDELLVAGSPGATFETADAKEDTP
ncbi:MAG: hypothetical protein ABSB68_10095 [Acidimicrobiales bacterium]